MLSKKQQGKVLSQTPKMHWKSARNRWDKYSPTNPTNPTQSKSQHWSLRNWLDFTVVLFSFMELLAASIPGSSTVTWVEQEDSGRCWCPSTFCWNLLGAEMMGTILVGSIRRKHLVFFVAFFWNICIYNICKYIIFRPSFVHHSCV